LGINEIEVKPFGTSLSVLQAALPSKSQASAMSPQPQKKKAVLSI